MASLAMTLLLLGALTACGESAPLPSSSQKGSPSSATDKSMALGSHSGNFLPNPIEETDACGIVQKRVIISTPQQLLDLARLVNSGDTTHQEIVYELAGDLDMGEIQMIPIGGGLPGDSADPPQFLGTFDGKGHTIRRLSIDVPNGWGVGLFGQMGDGSSVLNLTVEGVRVNGHTQVGGLVGGNYGGIVRACKVYEGTVTGQTHVGGLVGYLSNTSTSGAEISLSSAATVVTGNYGVGGFAGEGASGNVLNCRADGEVHAVTRQDGISAGESPMDWDEQHSDGWERSPRGIGGFIGTTESASLSQCYTLSILTVDTGSGWVGSFVGHHQGTLTNCMLLKRDNGGISTIGVSSGINGTQTPIELTEAQMMAKSSFIGWDFSTVWSIDEGEGFPHHIWDESACSSGFG